MTIETLFGTEIITSKPKSIRFRTIKPVWDRLVIKENVPSYLNEKTKITSAREVFELFRFLGRETKENFLTLHISTNSTIICVDLVSVGSLNAAITNPREIMKSALLSSCCSMIMIHNHPSQNIEPSREDIQITSRIKECCELFSIKLLDHIIICEDAYTSLSDRGVL